MSEIIISEGSQSLTDHETAVEDTLPFDASVGDLDSGLNLNTRVYILVGDLDVASGYPKGTCCFNTSRETTRKELVGIEGVPYAVTAMEGINLSGGFTNAVYYSTQMYGVPTLFQLDAWVADETQVPEVPQRFQHPNYHLLKKRDKEEDL